MLAVVYSELFNRLGIDLGDVDVGSRGRGRGERDSGNEGEDVGEEEGRLEEFHRDICSRILEDAVTKKKSREGESLSTVDGCLG